MNAFSRLSRWASSPRSDVRPDLVRRCAPVALGALLVMSGCRANVSEDAPVEPDGPAVEMALTEAADASASTEAGDESSNASEDASSDAASDESMAGGESVTVPPLPTMVPEERETLPPLYLKVDDLPADPEWVAERTTAQAATVDASGVRADFRLSDALASSGITWRHRATPDGAKEMKNNHYDHGNGVITADVDGDGLLDLYFVSQVGSNALYRGLGGGEFEDITAQAGVGLDEVISVTASFADIDNDGDPDLYVSTIKEGDHLFLNEGGGTFVDGTAAAGLGYKGHSSSADFFDYDKDGNLDLYLSVVGVYTGRSEQAAAADTNDLEDPLAYRYWVGLSDAFAGHAYADRLEVSRLYHNEGGGVFADVTEAMGLGTDPSWTGDMAPIDANEDGWIDLYVLDMQGNDEYYENQQGQAFVRRSREVFPYTPWGAMGAGTLDMENDGDLDLLVTDMHSDMMENTTAEYDKLKMRQQWPESTLRTGGISIFGNALFEADGGAFADVSDDTGAEMYWPWGLSIGDLNADGYEDALISAGMGFWFRYGPNSLLLNNAGAGFVDAEFAVGLEPRPDGSLFRPWFVVDCDGPDAGNRHCDGEEGIVRYAEAHSSRGTLLVDIDQDGDLDVIMGEWNAPPMVLTSNLSELGGLNYLTIDLEGTTSNRDGLGAVVRVISGAMTQTFAHDGQSGYLAQSDQPLYVGLGDVSAADRIEVTWPTGATQVLEGPIASGTAVEIVEESASE